MDFDAEFVERRYMINVEKLRAPGARVNIGESIAKRLGRLSYWFSRY